MAKNNEIAKRPVNTPATQISTPLGYGQMMIQEERPDKTLISRKNTCIWKLKEHFYNVPESSQNDNGSLTKTSVYRPTLEGKMMVAALAGCRHITRILDAQPEYVRAEAIVYYKDPSGEVIEFRREKEVSIQLERLAAITKKINYSLSQMKKTNGGNPARYKELSDKAMDIDDEVARQKFLQRELLDIYDMQVITDNMIKLRMTLANMAMSKALSSAYTEFLRYVGQRLIFKGDEVEEVMVEMINTIEIPKMITGQKAVKLLYDQTSDSEAEETEHLLESEDFSETTGKAKIIEGQVVDTVTGECFEAEFLPADEPEVEEVAESAMTAEDLITDIMAMVREQKMGKIVFNSMIEYHTDKKDFKDCDIDDLRKIHDLLRTPA